MSRKLPEKALQLIRSQPRVKICSLKDLPGSYTIKAKSRRSRMRGGKSGRGNKGQGQRMTLPRLGFEGGNVPFYLRIPKEGYYDGHHVRRQYPPFSLHELQRAIDVGRIDPDEPIDLTTICNTKLYNINPLHNHYGLHLTDEGAEIFAACVNIEVQHADESTIAAIERNGGMITTRFYNIECVQALTNPEQFFKKGLPIPRCALPSSDAFEYYTNPEFRGYLADPDKVREARYALSQKYGYEMPNYENVPNPGLFKSRKDPRQIFLGLWPGWVVCLKDKVILKPKDPEYIKYYES